MSLLDRVHIRLPIFEFNGNYAFILYCFRVISSYLSKVADFYLPHLHLSPSLGGDTLNSLVSNHTMDTLSDLYQNN